MKNCPKTVNFFRSCFVVVQVEMVKNPSEATVPHFT